MGVCTFMCLSLIDVHKYGHLICRPVYILFCRKRYKNNKTHIDITIRIIIKTK